MGVRHSKPPPPNNIFIRNVSYMCPLLIEVPLLGISQVLKLDQCMNFTITTPTVLVKVFKANKDGELELLFPEEPMGVETYLGSCLLITWQKVDLIEKKNKKEEDRKIREEYKKKQEKLFYEAVKRRQEDKEENNAKEGGIPVAEIIKN